MRHCYYKNTPAYGLNYIKQHYFYAVPLLKLQYTVYTVTVADNWIQMCESMFSQYMLMLVFVPLLNSG